MTGQASQDLRAVAVNLLGLVEHPELGDTPYRVSADGRPYVPAGDGGIVLGLRLGESSFGRDADHAAPGACLVHPDPAARHALTIYSCIGNQATVRTGQAAGARGVVVGKRGELGRVVVSFDQQDLARMRPSDQVAVRACGQGWRPPGFPSQVTLLNTDPAALRWLPVTVGGDGAYVTAGVRAVVPSKLAGNGIGRPAVGWDLDLQLGGPAAGRAGRPRRGTRRGRAARRPGRRLRPGRAVQPRVSSRLAHGRRDRARREPAARPRARYHADPHRPGGGAAGSAGPGGSCGLDRSRRAIVDCCRVIPTATGDGRFQEVGIGPFSSMCHFPRR